MKKPARTAQSAAAALVLLVLVVLGLAGASAAPRQPVVYDALGDSYASGFGVPPYGLCGRSQSAYAVQLDGRMKIALDDFVACAGATTASLVAGGQLNALDDNTDLVTISVGGNDIGWSSAVAACLGPSDSVCSGAIALALSHVTTTLPSLLDSVYSQISARAPDAHVLVVGYPQLFSPQYGAFLGASTSEQTAMNGGADVLNGVIAAAAARHGFGFVDVSKRFQDHGVNAPDPWINGPFDAAPFHPNVEGYQSYTAAVTAAIHPSELR